MGIINTFKTSEEARKALVEANQLCEKLKTTNHNRIGKPDLALKDRRREAIRVSDELYEIYKQLKTKELTT